MHYITAIRRRARDLISHYVVSRKQRLLRLDITSLCAPTSRILSQDITLSTLLI